LLPIRAASQDDKTIEIKSINCFSQQTQKYIFYFAYDAIANDTLSIVFLAGRWKAKHGTILGWGIGLTGLWRCAINSKVSGEESCSH